MAWKTIQQGNNQGGWKTITPPKVEPVEVAQPEPESWTGKALRFIKSTGKQIYQAGKETGAIGIDIATRALPNPIEELRGTYSGYKEIAKQPTMPALQAFEKGKTEFKARPLQYEKVAGALPELKGENLGQKLVNLVKQPEYRKAIGRAMELPTYAYAGAKEVAGVVAKPLLTRILTRTARALPEAGINTAIQQFEEGTLKTAPKNIIANALILSGISNIAGEIRLPKLKIAESVNDIEKSIGKLDATQRIDIEDALKQGVKKEDILSNLERVKAGEVAPEELAEAIKKQIEPTPEAPKLPVAPALNKKVIITPEKKKGILQIAKEEKVAKDSEKLKTIYTQSIANEDFMFGKETKEIEKTILENGKLNPKLVQGRINDVVQKMEREGIDSTNYKKAIEGKDFKNYFEFDKANREAFAKMIPDGTFSQPQGITPKVEVPKVEVPEIKKPSKIAKSIESKAIEKKLTEGYGEDLAGYSPITIKDQADRMSKIMTEDIERAKRIVAGEEELPVGLRGETAIKAMEDYALETGDSDLIRKIAQSPLTSETSAHAQAMRLMAERNPDSPTIKLQEIMKARKEAFEKTGKKVSSEVKAEKTKIKELTNKQVKPTKETWESFISGITC